jgi:glycosyltransferase involved in cell wall biosynthesis
MKFSIITPSFNQGRFIADCIESVMAQAGDSLEVEHIVTDAGSTDETLEVLRRYPHLQWTSEPDKGMSDGINKGFRKATGDWLMWLNCDDYLLPGTLSKVVDFIHCHNEADVIHGDCAFITEDNTFIRRKYDAPVDEWDLLFVGCVIPSTSTFYHRKIIDAGHFLDLNYKNTMDLEYYLRLMRLGYRFAYLPELIAHFRWHEQSTTLRNWQRMLVEGKQCQLIHIRERNLPDLFSNSLIFVIIKMLFKCRRILKRLIQHGRFR